MPDSSTDSDSGLAGGGRTRIDDVQGPAADQILHALLSIPKVYVVCDIIVPRCCQEKQVL